MDRTKIVSVEVALKWQSLDATHIDRRYYGRVDLWRDIFPGSLGEQLYQAKIGQLISQAVGEGELIASFDPHEVRTINIGQFNQQPKPGLRVEPHLGRFYPRVFLQGLPNLFAQDKRPFRIIDRDNTSLTIDLNHPFARYAAVVDVRLEEILGNKEERGGLCNDIGQDITENGPGMQARLSDKSTDFFTQEAFSRLDPRDDQQFYAEPRFVQHVDQTAIQCIGEIYRQFIRQGIKVLDLMSSWVSHIPPDIDTVSITGLGLNRQEMEKNTQLSNMVLHDLNSDPRIPFGNTEFDAVVCTVSVEYLIKPIEVFKDVARVLKPGGVFICSFSERWFPSKVIKLWLELHPFERMGLVLEYFRRSEEFKVLGTESVRARPRPPDDKYAGQLATSDPVYVVWGRKN